LRAITSQRQMAERSVAIANSEMQPSFHLNGNLQYQEDAFRSFLAPTNRSYAVGFAMRIPLFATPGAVARRTTAKAQIQEAVHGLDAALDSGRLEVTSAYTEWTASREVVEAQRKALDLARESLSIAQVSYENGLITSIELSDARQALVETEWNLAQAKFAQILAAAKTRYAAGLS
jgi:outer membrane protein TolC